jgi:uncharacterized protein
MTEAHVGIPYRLLGSTGEKVSIIGLGGAHIGKQADESESIAIVRTAIDNGVNFLDNCWDYNEGSSEIRMGKALRDGYRRKAFLMTKIDGQDARTAQSQIDESLRRLQTDVIDLLQLHEIIRPDDPDRIFAPGGAIEAVRRAREAGKCRYIGFTGHKNPDFHLRMLRVAEANGVVFDAVQMPLNIMDAHFNSFQQMVLPQLVNRKVGVLGMKPLGNGIILESRTVSARECLRYAMSLPVSVVITGCESLAVLEQAIDVARTFSPMSQAEIAELLERTAASAAQGDYEWYKTTSIFDSTMRHPEWLGRG